MNRRDFLDTGSLARSAAPRLVPFLDLPSPEDSPPKNVSLLRCSRPAMATLFELMLPFGTPGAPELANELFNLIDDLEAQMTIYRDDSEMSAINRRAAVEAVAVEPRLFELLAEAGRITAETWGAFDVTAGPLIKAWGFFRRQGCMPTPRERQDALNCVGMKYVELNSDEESVRFHQPGVEINLGSIGKGYALDRCVERLHAAGVTSALLHGGGSSVRGVGAQPGERRGWPVAIRHPWQEGRPIATVYLRDRAMGTSAATYQHFEYNSKKLGHLLDPRTGRPAEGVASATALAPTAARADALATAFYILGVEKTRLYCQTHPGVGAVLLPEGDGPPALFGLSPDDVSLPPAPHEPRDRTTP